MATMWTVQVPRAQRPFEFVERDIRMAGPGQVRIKVEACGICHSDSVGKEGLFPGIRYPRVLGHEVVGVIDAADRGVSDWRIGQRVGVGWHGGHCFKCEPCRRGDFGACQNQQIPGITYDGGYAEYWWRPSKLWRSSRTTYRPSMPRRCCAPGSRPTTPSGTVARGPVIWSPSSVSAGLAT
jgi:D-arabinose 1-dehydrogenase-like Zn-dependent alcohol dehydrogenase